MKAVRFSRFGGPEVLEIVNLPDPHPGPGQVRIEFGGQQLRVTPTQLDGDARAQVWQRITQLQPRYAGYEQKTDRAIPVIRLSRAG